MGMNSAARLLLATSALAIAAVTHAAGTSTYTYDALGRFLQTDPIGYGDGINWYNYGGADPVNNTDPSGLTTGSNIDSGPGLCPSCAGFSTTGGVVAATGEKGDREKGSNAQSAGGLIGTFVRLVFYDSAGNILGTTPWGFRPEPLFQHQNAGGLAGSFAAAAPAQSTDQNIVVTARRNLARAIDTFAENYLRPPPGRQDGESFSDCVRRIAGNGELAVGGRLGSQYCSVPARSTAGWQRHLDHLDDFERLLISPSPDEFPDSWDDERRWRDRKNIVSRIGFWRSSRHWHGRR